MARPRGNTLTQVDHLHTLNRFCLNICPRKTSDNIYYLLKRTGNNKIVIVFTKLHNYRRFNVVAWFIVFVYKRNLITNIWQLVNKKNSYWILKINTRWQFLNERHYLAYYFSWKYRNECYYVQNPTSRTWKWIPDDAHIQVHQNSIEIKIFLTSQLSKRLYVPIIENENIPQKPSHRKHWPKCDTTDNFFGLFLFVPQKNGSMLQQHKQTGREMMRFINVEHEKNFTWQGF